MEESPPRRIFGNGAHKEGEEGSHPRSLAAEDGGAGETKMECSGRGCGSCTGGAVAMCCCPCAALNLMALAFVKVPWMVGRRCLGRGKMKGERRESPRKCGKIKRIDSLIVERNGASGISHDAQKGEKIGGSSSSSSLGRFEGERVWSELFVQVGHLGFGRVSFSGEHSLRKSD